jgi:hypothetical protein
MKTLIKDYRTYFYFLFFIIFLGTNSCKKDIPQHRLIGKLLNSTGRPVQNAVVKLLAGNTTKYQVNSNQSGEFNFSNVAEGNYAISISADRYVQYSDQIQLNSDNNIVCNILGSANIQGTIIDSQTGRGLSGATVSFLADQNATSSQNPDLIATTNSSGVFSILNGPTGSYAGFFEASGFFLRKVQTVTFNSGTNTFTPITLVDKPDAGQWRIILNWGASPADLDAHLTGPASSTTRFHIYFSSKVSTYADLDVDDVSSYGPETTTIRSFLSGTYRYSVHNYTNRYSTTGGSGIASSPAVVEIYDSNGLIRSFTAPTFSGSGDTWRVFEIVVSGTTATVNTKNVYVLATSTTDTNIFKKGEENKGSTVLNIDDF